MQPRRRSCAGRISIAALATLMCVGLAASADAAPGGNPDVRVMTRNMDAGTDLAYVTTATTADDFVRGLIATIAEIDLSNIPARAARLAAEIAEAAPDLVALQEVTVWDITDGQGHRTYDQLALLQTALEAAGQHYAVAVQQKLADIEIPVPGLLDARFTDGNAILVRTDLPAGHLDVMRTQKGVYQVALAFTLPDGSPNGRTVSVPNGWVAVDVRVRGARFKFVNTHLLAPVPAYFEQTVGAQVLQATELLQILSGTTLPVIVAGDFNSDAEAAGLGPDQTPTAGILASAFTDVWHALHPDDRGFTWSLFPEDIGVTPIAGLCERIDLIYSLGPTPLAADRTGLQPDLQGVFTSDHAGVVADFLLQNHRPDVPIGRQ